MNHSKIDILFGKGIKLLVSVNINAKITKDYVKSLEYLINQSLNVGDKNKLIELLNDYTKKNGGEING